MIIRDFQEFEKRVGILSAQEIKKIEKEVGHKLHYDSEGRFEISELSALTDFCKRNPSYHVATETSDGDFCEEEDQFKKMYRIYMEVSEIKTIAGICGEDIASIECRTAFNCIRYVNREAYYLCNGDSDENIYLIEIDSFK